MEIPRGMGVSKAKIFKGKYEAKLEIPGGWEGPHQKTILGGGMDIFWNHTISVLLIMVYPFDGDNLPSIRCIYVYLSYVTLVSGHFLPHGDDVVIP